MHVCLPYLSLFTTQNDVISLFRVTLTIVSDEYNTRCMIDLVPLTLSFVKTAIIYIFERGVVTATYAHPINAGNE